MFKTIFSKTRLQAMEETETTVRNLNANVEMLKLGS